MANLIEHPNRPSAAIHRYAGELYAQARACEQSNPNGAAILRSVASRLREIAMTAETHYESKVCDLIMAALDVRDGGGWLSHDPQGAFDELNRCVNNLRTTVPREAA